MGENRLQVGGIASPVRGKATAHVHPGQRHARRPGHLCGLNDISPPSRRVIALRAGVKSQRGGKTARRDLAQEPHCRVRANPEFLAKIIGRARHWQGQPHRHFRTTRHRVQLVQLARAIHRIRRHTQPHRHGHLLGGSHRVVVVQNRIRADRAYRIHLARAGYIKGADTRRHQIAKHLLAGVGFHRVGHHAIEPRLKAACRRVKGGGAEIQHRIVGGMAHQMCLGIVPIGGIAHRSSAASPAVFLSVRALDVDSARLIGYYVLN